MTAAILSGHRRVPPYGVNGGEPGQIGRTALFDRMASLESMNSTDRRRWKKTTYLSLKPQGEADLEAQPNPSTVQPILS